EPVTGKQRSNRASSIALGYLLLADDPHQMPNLIIDFAWLRDRLSNFFTEQFPVPLSQTVGDGFDIAFLDSSLLRELGIGDGLSISPKMRLQIFKKAGAAFGAKLIA